MTKQEKSRQYYLDNKKEIAQKHKIYLATIKPKTKEYNRKYKEKSAERRLYHAAKARARLKGTEFNLDLKDIIIPELCPYLKTPLEKHKGMLWTNPSLDRIDNSKGYTKENIEVISKLANIMKAHSTKEQLITFAESVLQKFKSTNTW